MELVNQNTISRYKDDLTTLSNIVGDVKDRHIAILGTDKNPDDIIDEVRVELLEAIATDPTVVATLLACATALLAQMELMVEVRRQKAEAAGSLLGAILGGLAQGGNNGQEYQQVRPSTSESDLPGQYL